MSQEKFAAPSLEAMNALLPAFEFTNVMASNAMGAVYFANQISLGRNVAIKVFSPAVSGDASFRKSFENASKAEVGLKHSNLVGLFDFGFAGEMFYRVMEFVPGKSLSRSTRGQVIEFGQAMALLNGICEGLSYAHGKGLVHGNLDSLDILLNQQAVPKIGNFGLDRPVRTDAAAVVTSHCTAPEVLAKPGSATVRSDVYSLGAIFYELITGKPLKPEAAPASRLTDCKKEIDAVLKQATAKDPAKRMANVQAFHTALENAAAGAAIKKGSGSKKKNQSADEDVAASGKAAKVGFDWKILVKVGIIIGLLFGINILWKVKNKAHADRARENQEIIAKGERAKEAARALAEEMRQSNVAMPAKPAQPAEQSRPETMIPEFVPEEESPGQSLSRLKSSLVSGSRVEMPAGSVRKGDSDYFLIEQPMTWADAAWFAEQHGAHLATPDKDLKWLSEQVTKGNVCWIGAARGGPESWTLVTGEAWTPEVSLSGVGNHLSFRADGEFSAEDGSSEFPFVIQWRVDGSNPGTLAAALLATRDSFKTEEPVFPPGTVASGSRHYLYVPRETTWEEAGSIADSSGGHLLVVSDTEELSELEEITKSFNATEGIWLGGSLEEDLWSWVTAESWSATNWISNAAASDDGAALILLPGEGWDGRDRADTASGFIIEWSADADAAENADPVAGIRDVSAELNAKVKELIIAADTKRKDDLAANMKKFKWDLDPLLRNLSRSQQDEWEPHFTALKECVVEDRLLTDQIEPRGIAVSPDMAKLVVCHSKKEGEIDAGFDETTQKIRDAFVVKMSEIRASAEQSGQIKVASGAAEAIEEAMDLAAWIRSFVLISDETIQIEE